MGSSEMRLYLVRDGFLYHGNSDHLSLGSLGSFFYGLGYIKTLGNPNANYALSVSYNHRCAEPEMFASRSNHRNASQINELGIKLAFSFKSLGSSGVSLRSLRF